MNTGRNTGSQTTKTDGRHPHPESARKSPNDQRMMTRSRSVPYGRPKAIPIRMTRVISVLPEYQKNLPDTICQMSRWYKYDLYQLNRGIYEQHSKESLTLLFSTAKQGGGKSLPPVSAIQENRKVHFEPPSASKAFGCQPGVTRTIYFYLHILLFLYSKGITDITELFEYNDVRQILRFGWSHIVNPNQVKGTGVDFCNIELIRKAPPYPSYKKYGGESGPLITSGDYIFQKLDDESSPLMMFHENLSDERNVAQFAMPSQAESSKDRIPDPIVAQRNERKWLDALSLAWERFDVPPSPMIRRSTKFELSSFPGATRPQSSHPIPIVNPKRSCPRPRGHNETPKRRSPLSGMIKRLGISSSSSPEDSCMMHTRATSRGTRTTRAAIASSQPSAGYCNHQNSRVIGMLFELFRLETGETPRLIVRDLPKEALEILNEAFEAA